MPLSIDVIRLNTVLGYQSILWIEANSLVISNRISFHIWVDKDIEVFCF